MNRSCFFKDTQEESTFFCVLICIRPTVLTVIVFQTAVLVFTASACVQTLNSGALFESPDANFLIVLSQIRFVNELLNPSTGHSIK